MSMTSPEFIGLFESILKNQIEVTAAAQKEYARPENVFDNFDRLSVDMEMDRKKVLYVYMKKHLDAIRKFILDPANNIREPIEGRIGDVIVYLVLLQGMILDERGRNTIINTNNSSGISIPPEMLAQLQNSYTNQREENRK